MAYTHGPSITHQQALTHFLELGPGRTLPKLAKALAEIPGIENPPKIDCLKRWSRTHKWFDEAERYDAGVIDRTREQLIERQVEQNFRWSEEFAKTGAEVLERVRKTARTIVVKTTQDLATLANVAVICAREADAMEGAKPLAPEEPATQAKPDNVTEGQFPAQPAAPSETERKLAILEQMTGDDRPPN